MAKQPPIEDLNRDELLKLIRELMVRIDRLREENERLKRTQRRQASPFSKETPVANPKNPAGNQDKVFFTAARRRSRRRT